MISVQRALQHTYLPLLVKMETWRDSAKVTWAKSTTPQMSLVLPRTLWNAPTQPTPRTVSTLQSVRGRLATEMQEPQLEMGTSGGGRSRLPLLCPSVCPPVCRVRPLGDPQSALMLPPSEPHPPGPPVRMSDSCAPPGPRPQAWFPLISC